MSRSVQKQNSTIGKPVVLKKQLTLKNDSSKKVQKPQQPLNMTRSILRNDEVIIKPIAKAKKSKNPEDQPLWDFAGDALSGMAKKALTHGLNILTGFGDYDVVSNSLLEAATSGARTQVPIMYNSKVANVIRHREYVRDIFSSSTSFAINTIDLNPGLDSSFPWLSYIAQNYTNWRPRGMVFEFVPLASNYSSTPSLGYVCFATQYNPFDPVFPDKKTMENSEYANSCKPSGCADGEPMAHPIECARDQLALAELYIRGQAAPSGSDIRLFDLGRFSYAVGGQSASDVVIGELWCTYEIEFFFPRLYQHIVPTSNFAALSGTAVSPSAWLNNSTIHSSSTFTPIITSNNVIRFPPETVGQRFVLSCQWQQVTGTLNTYLPPTVTAGAGLTLFNPAMNTLTYGTCPWPAIATQNFSLFFLVQINTSATATLTFSSGGVTDWVTSIWEAWICQVPQAFALENDVVETGLTASSPIVDETPKTELLETHKFNEFLNFVGSLNGTERRMLADAMDL